MANGANPPTITFGVEECCLLLFAFEETAASYRTVGRHMPKSYEQLAIRIMTTFPNLRKQFDAAIFGADAPAIFGFNKDK